MSADQTTTPAPWKSEDDKLAATVVISILVALGLITLALVIYLRKKGKIKPIDVYLSRVMPWWKRKQPKSTGHGSHRQARKKSQKHKDPFYYISMFQGGKANESDYQKNYYDEIDYQQQNNYDFNKSKVGPNIQAYNTAEEVEYQKNTYDIYNSKFGGVMPATAQQAYTGSLLQIQQMQAVNMADEVEYQKNIYDIYNSKIQPAVPAVAQVKAHRGIGDAKKKRRDSTGQTKQSAGTGGHDEAMNLMQDFTSKMWAADVRQAAQQPVPEHVAMAQPTYEGEHFDEGQAYRGMKKDVGKKSAGKKSK